MKEQKKLSVLEALLEKETIRTYDKSLLLAPGFRRTEESPQKENGSTCNWIFDLSKWVVTIWMLNVYPSLISMDFMVEMYVQTDLIVIII